ncbi:ABC transporter ATP-binding protein [Crocinitomix catalasitica]|uniref:ABC transporter ATP-binding protein n=1 Tax=Crocinitomix catalasitica TaxID=184607 RepID=UPI0004825CD6|nr:ABC transporter ATP-binding protein [Crocinitomix catalasitica]
MIQVNNLKFRYTSEGPETIKGITFTIEKGQIFGLLGPSGSGKSTTQKILYKLLSGYEGSAKIKNKEVSDWGKELYEQIGVGFELPNHYLKLSALENLKFFQSFYGKNHDPMKLLKMVGLEMDADKKVSEFSKGMKMRLNFVRAFAHDPEVLFLDEPTSGLDPTNSRIIKDIILNLKKEGKTILITTHHMEDAEELCDQVAFLSTGEIKTLDSPQNLKLEYGKNTVEVLTQSNLEPITFDLKTLKDNDKFLDLIQTEEIKTIHSKEANLNDIFIEVTGQKLK